MTGAETNVLWPRLAERLDRRRSGGLIRRREVRHGPQTPAQTLDNGTSVSFCSNDYLGLAAHPAVIAALQQGAEKYGVGSGGSHMVTGHCSVHQALEEALANFVGRDRALLFSTGYMANTGVIHALMGSDGLVLQDALNHASLLDGGWLCRAESRRYPHGDMQALSEQLSGSTASHHLLVSDGVFSMDGDVAPLSDLVALGRGEDRYLMIDDAHGIGCIGKTGQGVIACEGGLIGQDDIPLLIGTLGKAFGTSGAFVAGEASLIEYLLQFTRSYMFTTAMPPAIASASLAALQLVCDEHWRRERLQQLIAQFRKRACGAGFTVSDSATPVQAIILGDATVAVRASEFLACRGLHIPAIRPPTVPQGMARIRLTFSAAHTDAQCQLLFDALDDLREWLERDLA